MKTALESLRELDLSTITLGSDAQLREHYDGLDDLLVDLVPLVIEKTAARLELEDGSEMVPTHEEALVIAATYMGILLGWTLRGRVTL